MTIFNKIDEYLIVRKKKNANNNYKERCNHFDKILKAIKDENENKFSELLQDKEINKFKGYFSQELENEESFNEKLEFIKKCLHTTQVYDNKEIALKQTLYQSNYGFKPNFIKINVDEKGYHQIIDPTSNAIKYNLINPAITSIEAI